LLHTLRTEVVKGGTTGIRDEDFRHAGGDTAPYQLVQGVHEVLPKTDVSTYDEIEHREVLRGEVRKVPTSGSDVDAMALGVQLEIRKHRGIGVQACHLSLERFGTGDADQPPAAAKLQYASLWGHATLVEVVQQNKTAGPDPVPME
jgi:hypothetical protein